MSCNKSLQISTYCMCTHMLRLEVVPRVDEISAALSAPAHVSSERLHGVAGNSENLTRQCQGRKLVPLVDRCTSGS
jgi:hypothetical protein